MEVTQRASSATAASVPLERLADDKHLSESDKIQEVSRQFEAVLLRQILASAQKPVFNSKAGGESSSLGIYRDMVTAQLADKISSSGSIGIANALSQQLRGQLHTEASPAAVQKPESFYSSLTP